MSAGAAANGNGRIHVLMVEDDCDNQATIKLYLEVLGFEVMCARNGVEALQMLALYIPDVILLDLVMPEMTGWEFLEVYPGPVPVIVLSAWTDMQELPREPYAVVLKPTHIAKVVAPLIREAARWRTEGVPT